MKAYAEDDCSKLFVLLQTKCVSKIYILKHCHMHIVLIQPYSEPGNNFNVLFV